MEKVKVKILLDENMGAQVPEYKTTEAAGADVRIVFNPNKPDRWANTVNINPLMLQKEHRDNLWTFLGAGETRLFDLGFSVEVPKGYELQLRSRSGMAKKGIFVINSPGTIDSDYRGPMMVLLHNAGSNNFTLNHGDRIGQLVLKRAPQAEFVMVDKLSDTERGEGGFGSTGVK